MAINDELNVVTIIQIQRDYEVKLIPCRPGLVFGGKEARRVFEVSMDRLRKDLTTDKESALCAARKAREEELQVGTDFIRVDHLSLASRKMSSRRPDDSTHELNCCENNKSDRRIVFERYIHSEQEVQGNLWFRQLAGETNILREERMYGSSPVLR